MKHVVFIVPLLALLCACSNKVPQDGFKQFKYGMTLEELKGHGMDCKPDDLCSPKRGGIVPEETIFGHPAEVMVWTKLGRLTQVIVNTDCRNQI